MVVSNREQFWLNKAEENVWGIMGYPTFSKERVFNSRKEGTKSFLGHRGQFLLGAAVKIIELQPSSS